MAIGCIQAQQCHTDHCPTGVATQHPWLVRGLDPTSKAAQVSQLHRHAPEGRASAESRVRRPTSGARHGRSVRVARRPDSARKRSPSSLDMAAGSDCRRTTDCEEVRRLM